jgi:hypothetical protein
VAGTPEDGDGDGDVALLEPSPAAWSLWPEPEPEPEPELEPETCAAGVWAPAGDGSSPAPMRAHNSARTTRKIATLAPMTGSQPGRRRMGLGAVLMEGTIGRAARHALGED